MYKIKQVAHMLGVSTVDIHGQLIEQREVLKEHIHKNTGVTFIDAEGVKSLARFFESLVDHRTNQDQVTDAKGVQSVESQRATIEEWLNDNQLTNMDEEMKIFQLREKISQLKNQINKTDQEILLKDEAIEHYLQTLGLR